MQRAPSVVLLALCVAVLTVGLSGCGGSAADQSSPTPTASAPTPAARAPTPAARASAAATAPPAAPATGAGEVTPPTPTPPTAKLPLPVSPVGTVELTGQWRGKPYWARLLPGQDPRVPKDFRTTLGNHLELVYTPPTAADLGGIVLADHPYITVDAALRVLNWDERSTTTLSALTYRSGDKPGYIVDRGAVTATGEHAEKRLAIGLAAPVWDVHLAPVLLALAWRVDGPAASGAVTGVDFFGTAYSTARPVRWTGTAVTIGTDDYTITAAADGTLAALTPVVPAAAAPVFTVTARLATAPGEPARSLPPPPAPAVVLPPDAAAPGG